MKKVFMLAAMIVAITGMTMAQTSPKPAAKQPVKKEATAPAKEEVAKNNKAKKGGGHHHKKHAKAAKQS